MEASLSAYPLAELLLGILRSNLSGKLELFLHPEPRNQVVFKDGVPVSAQLPDAGVSLVKILIDSGEMAHDKGLDLLRMAEASGRSEEAVIEQHKVLSAGALDEARRRRCRAQLVRLFDSGPLDFRFTEGAEMPASMRVTILQPLPLVFQGLYRAKDKTVVGRFLETHARSTFELAGTFPRGVDPFEWGPQVERIITKLPPPLSMPRLVQSGMPDDLAAAALTSLFLADMLELREQGAGIRPAAAPPPPAVAPAPASPAPIFSAPPEAARKEPRRSPPGGSAAGGLMIHRRAGQSGSTAPKPTASNPSPQGASAPQRPTPARSGHDEQLQSVRQRVGPIAAQNYFQVLRLAPGSATAQLERAYSFLLRRVEDAGDDAGWQATKDVLHEAFAALRDPDRAKRYASLVAESEDSPAALRERHALEAGPKVDRSLCAMAEGRTGEASFLLAWAERLDSTRTDVPVLLAVLDYLRVPAAQRGDDARALQLVLAQELTRQPTEWRLKLCQALVLAELNDARGANALLSCSPDPDHPMVRLVRSKLRPR